MNASQSFIVTILLSLPVIGLVAISRSLLCAYRCRKARKTSFFVFSCLYIVIMISVLAFDVVVLFAYGVAHTGKSASTDLIVLAITITPTYLVAGSIWFLSRFMEKRLSNNGA
jgi:hypothetical protein